MPEDTNEKTPILLLKKLLEGKQPPPDRGADGPLTVKGVQSRDFARREQNAKELKSTQESKGPKPETGVKPKTEAISDKYKEELVRSGTPLTIEKKLQIIEHEVPEAKTLALKRQFEELKNEIRNNPQGPDSRGRIQSIVKGIQTDAAVDKDLNEVAQEITQSTYNHIMRNKAYMVGISIDDRAEMGVTFIDAKSSRIYEDENYLRDIGENILRRPLTAADIQAEVQVSEDLVKHLNAGGDEADVDLVVKTMRPVEKLDEKTARQKIAEGPRWVKDAASKITRDSYALSFLGEMSDVYKMNPDLVDDPTKLNPALLFTKGVQLRVDNGEFYTSQGESSDVMAQMQEGTSVRDTVVDQVKLAIEGRPMFTSDRWDEHLYLMSEPKAFALGAGVDYEWDSAAEPVRAGALKDRLDEFNSYVHSLTGDVDEQVYKLYGDLHHDYRADLTLVPNLVDRLAKRIDEVSKLNAERHKAFSNLYFEYVDQMPVYRNPALALRETQDYYNELSRLYPNTFQESVERNRQNMISFLNSPHFQADWKAFFDDDKNWGFINEGYDPAYKITVRADLDKHPMYKVLKDKNEWAKYRGQLVDSFTQGDLLQRGVTTFKTSEIEKMRGINASIGEKGQIILRRDRGGINNRAYLIMDRKGEFSRFDNDGDEAVASGPNLKRAVNKAKHEMKKYKEHYLPKLAKVYGPNVDFDTMVDAAVDEMYSQQIIETRRAEWMEWGAPIWKVGGQKDNPFMFAGLGPEANVLTAWRPIDELMERWGTISASGRHVIEEAAKSDVMRLSIDKYVDPALDKIDLRTAKGKQDFRRLVKNYLGIVEPETSPRYAAIEQQRLVFFEIDEHGIDLKEQLRNPTSIDKLTKKDLRRLMTFTLAKRAATDREATGAYRYRSASWNADTMIQVMDKKYTGHNEVLLQERLSRKVADLFNPEISHDSIENAQFTLTHIVPEDPTSGMLLKLGEYSPMHAVDALQSECDIEILEFINREIPAANHAYHDPEEAGLNAIGPGRRDLFMERFIMRQDMINADCAEAGEMPWNFSKPIAAHTPRQIAIAAEICRITQTDMNEFFALGGRISEHVLEPETLESLSNPAIAQYFLVVHDQDPRYIELDDGVPGDPEFQYSLQIAKDDYAGNNGIYRNLNDTVNAAGGVVKDFKPMVEAGDEKTFTGHREAFYAMTEMVGGYNTKAVNNLKWTAAWYGMVRMDYGKDIVGMKGEHPFFPMSDHQRIVGIGGLALPLEKVDLAWHAADVATGGKFHKLFPHLTHVTMKRLNLIAAEIGWPNFLQDFGKAITKRTGWRGVERLFHHKFEIQTVWVPRAVALAGLAVLLWGTQTWSNLKKGFSGNSSHAQPEHG